MAPHLHNLLLYIGILALVALVATSVGVLFGPKKGGKAKHDPYECGAPILQSTRSKFDVRFFMLAMLFILFDIELVLLLPYAVQYKTFGVEGLVVAGIFFLGPVEGLVYAWKKGALDWK